ncbi:MAG TPA: transposase [Candidatus Methylomirabilis sp.]
MTLAAHRRERYFVSAADVEVLRSLLLGAADTQGFRVWAYCFMPDHLHILVEGKEPDASLPEFIRVFKQRSAHVFRQRYGKMLWQRSYYDHVLRKDEDIQGVVRYIFENPVRKGMIEDFRRFPFSGPPEILEALS